MGRIKVIIAEGICHGPPGTTPFERKRNLVAFSFQHTPLCEQCTLRCYICHSDLLAAAILEESGIAWPNPGMFYQIQHEDINPLSPGKGKEPDPDSHAHSPRPHTSVTGPINVARLTNRVPPPSFPYAMMQRGMRMHPPSSKASGPQLGDHFPPQYSHHDPFNSINDQVHRRLYPQAFTRHTSSSGDVSMHDAAPKSRSTISDQSMLDYGRAYSPVTSYKSFSMYDYPQPLSPESHRSFSHDAASGLRFQSPDWSRQVSAESLRGPRMQRLFSEAGAQRQVGNHVQEESQFAEMVDAMSPRKDFDSGCHPPVNTRVSSAANTPPTALRSSAAAEARALSYSGKTRSVPNPTRDPPPPTYSRASSDALPQARTKSRKSDSRQSEIGDDLVVDLPATAKKAPSGNVKSRKENRNVEVGHEDVRKTRRRASSGSALAHDKGNVGTPQPPSGDNKRRRISSNSNVKLSLALGAQDSLLNTPVNHNIDHDNLVISSDKINDIDDLTAEGVVQRAPLGDMGNII